MYQPSRLWYVEGIKLIVKACVILHNMACEENRHRSSGSRAVRLDAATSEFANADDIHLIRPLNGAVEASAFWQSHLDGIEDSRQCLQLKEAPMKYMWSRAAPGVSDALLYDDN
jgi:Plant transposon protein